MKRSTVYTNSIFRGAALLQRSHRHRGRTIAVSRQAHVHFGKRSLRYLETLNIAAFAIETSLYCLTEDP